jgi:hypothetical protein
MDHCSDGKKKLGKEMDDVIFWTGLISEQSRKRYKKEREIKVNKNKRSGWVIYVSNVMNKNKSREN